MTCEFDAQSHTYRLEGRVIPGVTSVLALAGYCDDFTFADPVKREVAKIKGSFIHEATVLIDQGRLDWNDLDLMLRPYCVAYQSFLQHEPFVSEAAEELVWTENYGGCAGMLDRRGRWGTPVGIGDAAPCILDIGDAAPCILDIKTGKSLSRWTRYQLAGYVALHLERAGCQDIPHEFRRWQRRIVWLKEDGTYACPSPFTDPADLERFLAALVVAHTKLLHNPKPRGKKEEAA